MPHQIHRPPRIRLPGLPQMFRPLYRDSMCTRSASACAPSAAAQCASLIAPYRDRASPRRDSHRLLKFEHEFVHRFAARRLDREVTRILGMAPEIALGNQLESSRFNFTAQHTFLDAMQGLADRDAVARARGMVSDHKRPARLECRIEFAVHLSAV